VYPRATHHHNVHDPHSPRLTPATLGRIIPPLPRHPIHIRGRSTYHPLCLVQMARATMVCRTESISSRMVGTSARIRDKVLQVNHLFSNKKNASLSYPRTCQDRPSRQHTSRLPTPLLVTIVIPIPLLADQMLAWSRRYGCLHLQHPRRRPASDRTHRSVL